MGWLSLRARHRARDPQVEITLSLITPYVAYWVPEHFGGSGVIATVACGLYMSWNGPLLISSATRLQGIFFWDLVIYLIEGLLFLLTGFQMRSLFETIQGVSASTISCSRPRWSPSIIIVARFAWVFPATYLPRLLSKRLRARDPAPPWRWVFVHRLHRRARRGLAGRGAGAAVRAAERRKLSLPRPHSVRLLRRHFHHAGRARAWAAAGGAMARRRRRPAATNRWRSTSRKSRRGARRSAPRCKSLDAITDDRELSDEVVKLLRGTARDPHQPAAGIARSRCDTMSRRRGPT